MAKTEVPPAPKTYPLEVKLPSGKLAVIREFKGRDVMKAMKIAGTDDPHKIIFSLMALTTTIDEKPIVMEDIEDMNGKDVLALIGEFGEAF
jgi:hypothetical protein